MSARRTHAPCRGCGSAVILGVGSPHTDRIYQRRERAWYHSGRCLAERREAVRDFYTSAERGPTGRVHSASAKGSRRCNSPLHRVMVQAGRGYRGYEVGSNRELVFCDDTCETDYLRARRTATCAVNGCEFLETLEHHDGGACPVCDSVEVVLSLSAEGLHRHPRTSFEVSGTCHWCWSAPFTGIARCLDQVDLAELERRVGTDCSSVEYSSLTCSPDCAKPAASFWSKSRGTATRTGGKNALLDIGDGRPLLTKRALLELRKVRTCWKCGDDLVDWAPNTAKAWELDHLIPIKLGGMHASFNVAPACQECNGQRGGDGTDLCLWYSTMLRREVGSKDRAASEQRWPWSSPEPRSGDRNTQGALR
ncbi:MAG: hypothetical protein JWN72_759 [Thermoleophilia bacterium]|nr:hypothetical protein [Thermoleophilia bacterium]